MVEMKDLIPSKDVRWYLERQGRVLTDFEKATLVYNHSGMDHEEKEKALVDILKMTEDFELQDQIRDRLTHDQFCIAKFYYVHYWNSGIHDDCIVFCVSAFPKKISKNF